MKKRINIDLPEETLQRAKKYGQMNNMKRKNFIEEIVENQTEKLVKRDLDNIKKLEQMITETQSPELLKHYRKELTETRKRLK